jgi:outer membrane protein assembly factor BamB
MARGKGKDGRGAGAGALLAALACLSPSRADAEDLRRVISHEDPSFDVAASRLAMGRDGHVYLASGSYVIRMLPDGTERTGSKVTYATTAVAANRAGQIATANAHFNHCIKLLTHDFVEAGSVTDFLTGQQGQWQSPSDVEAGPSGDFYAVDPDRNRVLRIATPGRTVATYPLDQLGEDLGGKSPLLRVWEAGQRLHVLSGSTVRTVAFDGRLLWSVSAGSIGGFDVTDDGRLFTLANQGTALQVYDVDGHPSRGPLPLQMGDRKGPISGLRVFGDEVFIKRSDPQTLFEVYSVATGAFRRAIAADVDVVTVSLPGGGTWTAGAPLPLAIRFVSGKQLPAPPWHAWLRPLGTAAFEELPLHDGLLTPPADAAGLYQLRVSAAGEGAAGDYAIDKIVEVRRPASKGSVSIFTHLNRRYFGAGEPIPVTVAARGQLAPDAPGRITVELRQGSNVVARTSMTLRRGESQGLLIRPELTRVLRPGSYLLTADVADFTVAGQPLEIGPGMTPSSNFKILQYGDYESSIVGSTAFDAPEKVAARLDRSRKLGVDMFVDRLTPTDVDSTLTQADLAARLDRDPDSVSSAKLAMEGPARQTIAARGANGIEERSILLGNDSGLPVGDRFDALAQSLTQVTTGLAKYPALRGWSWAANWWTWKLGANAAATADEKAAYVAAMAQAKATGAWSKVLDTVSDHFLSLPVDAERQFRAVLEKVAPGQLSVMTGPYRALGILPPVSFRNADEVDLHFQSEQIQPPLATAHNVDFYKRPGKPAWGHPEVWNDDGTGGALSRELLAMTMRGADGVGWSGEPPWFATRTPYDARSAAPGTLSMVRAVDGLLLEYGPWLRSLRGADPIALVVSSRMIRIDGAGKLGGEYFTRLYEAYGSALAAHRPAMFVFADDLTPDTLKSFQAVLVVGQRVELEPRLRDALMRARSAGVGVYFDGTCRPEVVAPFTPLGASFDQVERDATVWQDDSAYLRVPGYFAQHAEAMAKTFGSKPAAVAGVDDPAVLLTSRASGRGRFVWVLDNVETDTDPGLAWRTGLLISERMPLVVPVRLDAGPDEAVYDMFAQRRVQPNGGPVDADLRDLPARIFAILPRAIDAVQITAPRSVVAGSECAWSAAVLDDRGHPLDAGIPIQVDITGRDGGLLERRSVSTDAHGLASGASFIPLDPPAGPLVLRVVERISGQEARASIDVTAPAQPTDLADAPAPSTTRSGGKGTATVGHEISADPPVDRTFGRHFKEATLLSDGRTAVLGAMDRDENLYAVDIGTGELRWQRRVGNHFAYGPRSIDGGLAVEAFDRTAAEGRFLYLLGMDGQPTRRFALYGLPTRATHWAAPAQLLEHGDDFATSPDGQWVASAGDLGLVVWDHDGRRRWGLDWWRTARRHVKVVAYDRKTLITLEGPVAKALDAGDGHVLWTLRLGALGELTGASVGARGMLVVRSNIDGGRVFLIRNGQLAGTIESAADEVAISPDERAIALTTGSELRWYCAGGGLLWTFSGDETLRGPRIGPDGRRIVVGSELGTVTMLDDGGRRIWTRDYGALASGTWLPGGSLLVATWTGKVERLDAAGATVWSTHLEPVARIDRPDLLRSDATPTTRVDSWGDAAAQPAPLTPNLLLASHARVTAVMGDRAQAWLNSTALLTDGKPDAPPKPWLYWNVVGLIDSGWVAHMTLDVDSSPATMRVTGVTFVEDPAHPESWLRDMRLQYRATSDGPWIDGPYLLSNASTHTHLFDKPIEGSRFRFMTSDGAGWPAANLRLGELVFQGTLVAAPQQAPTAH